MKQGKILLYCVFAALLGPLLVNFLK